MVKHSKKLMILFSLLLWGSGIWALEQDADGVYQIGTAEDLVAFSELVNNGEYAANAVLTADIDLNGISYFPPIGKQYWPQGPELYFSGTFDGQGHIIYNLSIDKDDSGAETGLFGRLNGATVRNLGIVNATLKNSSALRAGVLGGCAVNSKVINCFTAGDIVTEECICSFNHRNGSGLLGLIASGAIVSNCYTTYETICSDDSGTTIDNCFWGEDVANMAPTGELCYKLNGDQNTITWFQNLGEDAYPVLNAERGTVIKNEDGSYDCITGVDTVHSTESTVHVGVYDLSGRRIEKKRKGISIINKKKVLVSEAT